MMPWLANRRLAIRPLAGAAGLALAVGLGWLDAPATAPPAYAPPAEAWSLPTLAQSQSGRGLAEVTALRPWSADRRPAAPPNPSPTAGPAPEGWRLAGIVLRGEERFVLITGGSVNSQDVEYKRVGDTLPDGSIILQISQDSVITEGGASSPGGRTTHRLFDSRK